MYEFRRFKMKKIRVAITIIAVIALIAVGFLSARLLDKDDNVKVSTSAIQERLSKCSSLTTAKLDYRGIIKYEDGDIQYINKKSFSMIYNAHVTAGVDLSQASVEVKDRKIIITIPKATLQEIIVDADSLEFYDEKLALFNWTDKEDTAKAMEYAKKGADERAAQTDILTQASEQAKTVIETLIMPIAEDNGNEYELELKTN